MDELEQEFPLLHPEYSPILSFLYQNLPFVSIIIGTAGNAYAIRRLQNSIQLPIRLEKVEPHLKTTKKSIKHTCSPRAFHFMHTRYTNVLRVVHNLQVINLNLLSLNVSYFFLSIYALKFLRQGVGNSVVHVQSGFHSDGGELICVGFARWELEPRRHHVPPEQEFGDAARVRQPLVPGGRRLQFQPPASTKRLPQVVPRLYPRLSHRLRILRIRTVRNTVRTIYRYCPDGFIYF